MSELFRSSTGRRWGSALLALAAAWVALPLGCASGRAARSSYHDPNMDFSLIQTVAVMPLTNLTANPNAAERVRDVLMTMLQAGGGLYVLPPGEVARGAARANVALPSAPTPEEAVALCKIVGADVILTGTVLEYGEVRSGSSAANAISISAKLMESQTGKVVFSASTTEGGIKTSDRLFGGGGEPMDEVTERAIDSLLDQLFER